MASLEELRRAVLADPTNIEAAVELLNVRARIEGPDVLLEPLKDRVFWNETHEQVQNLAIYEVQRRLAGSYELEGIRVWSCPNNHECRLCQGGCTPPYKNAPCPRCNDARRINVLLSHRLATFHHTTTGLAFNLLPGDWPVDLDCHELGCISPTGNRRTIDNTEAVPLRVDFINQEEVIASFRVEPFSKVRVRVGQEHMEAKPRAFRLAPKVRPFLIGRRLVAWGELRGQRALQDPAGARDHSEPTSGFNREACVRWLEDRKLIFPTGKEWIYAYRGGSATRFYWGDGLSENHVQLVQNARDPARRVKSVQGWNGFGLVDMESNAWQCLPEDTEGCFEARRQRGLDVNASRSFEGRSRRRLDFSSEAMGLGLLNFSLDNGFPNGGFRAAALVPGFPKDT